LSDPREQSYYEIALTNKQVMTIFVVLLICVLAAFLGGVWVGRGTGATVLTAEAQEIESGVQPGEPPLQRLDIFSESDKAGSQSAEAGSVATEEPQAAAAETQQPVILEDIGRPAVRAQQSQAQQPAVESRATPTTSAPSPGPSTGGSTGAAATSPGGREALVIQVFSSTDLQQAQKVMERLRTGNYPAVLSSVDVDGKVTYRVRVGPYGDREAAQGIADRIRRAYKLETWITR
jgi:cell division septation protein DedD